MKFLFDPVYTNRPSVCSTSYLCWELIENLMAWRDDTYFYVVYPPNRCDDKDRDFLARYADRVTLLPVEECTSDRVSEAYMLRNSLRFLLNPWADKAWDVDVILSSRMPVLKHMRVHSSRNMGKMMPSYRMYVGLEEMPILPFRDTVPWSDYLYPDTLMSYALCDAVLVNNQWTKQAMKPVLKEVLSPAYQKRVMDNLHEVVPIKLQRLVLKEEMYKKGEFRACFVGRITSTRNFGDVVDLFRKTFAYPIGKNRADIKFAVSTNSMSMGSANYGEMDFIDLQMNDREKFYAFLHGAHVVLNLSTVEDFSLSTYETLRRGVPIIVYDEPWNQFLGPTYPFRAKSEVEAYAILTAFASDYASQYSRFANWECTYWKQYVEGPLNVTTGEKLVELVTKFVQRREEVTKSIGGNYRHQLQSIAGDEIDLSKYIRENGRMLSEVPEHFSLPLGKVPTTLTMKLVAQRMGYTDTNRCGLMRKVV